MKKSVKRLALLLALCLCLVGCGDQTPEKENNQVDPAPEIEQLPDLKVEDCYTYTDNKDGTYSYTIKGRSGLNICHIPNTNRSASFAPDGEDVLIVYGQYGTGVGARWAFFCNIETCRMSDTFGGFLTAKNGRMAFIDQRTNAYHVFICDPFNANEYESVHTLEGLVVPEGGDVLESFELNDEGILSVTYATEKGNKTVEIDMNPKTE